MAEVKTQSTGFSFSGFMNDLGSSVQKGATSWLDGEIKNRSQPGSSGQPDSTLSQASAEIAAALENNKKVLFALIAFIAVGGLMFLIKRGRSRGRR